MGRFHQTSIFTFFAVLSILLFIASCATIFKGNSNNVEFSSDPQGAKVYVNGNLVGKTPTKLKLESQKTYYIEFQKEGYESRNYTITNHVGGGWIILDILGGLIPVIIDAATGSWYELDQSSINAVLESQQTINEK